MVFFMSSLPVKVTCMCIDLMFCSEGDVDGRIHGKREIDCSQGSRGRLGVYVPV